MSMLSRRYAAVAAACLVSLTVMQAQNSPAHMAELKKDAAELHAYTLTMDIVTRTFVTGGALHEALNADPALKQQVQTGSEYKDDQATLSQMAAALAASPKLVSILASHGFTPRTFALSEMSIILTGFASAGMAAGAGTGSAASQGANPDNIKLFQAHKAEIEELGRKYPLQDTD